ncbi:DUF2249 domain-containing protein [Streptomyces tagetis]|uniref:DUF2249 domain-containing protein n=1 Tax=Streptomyces tagetis TaxID=2820809 RepID=A0A941AZC2_9ACTN|nr:DUF2249 domain-containing protein [Streptomyces sp. RG38]MBQ0825206.1 DUF2249 domain-containing protein [Streptomyces sp. RG38]
MTASSEVYIEGTATDPAVEARAAVEEAHRRLRAGLAAARATDARSGGEGAAAGDAGGSDTAAGGLDTAPGGADTAAGGSALAGFCAGELRRHLSAVDRTLYAAASGAAETRLLVRALRTVTAALGGHVDALLAADVPEAAGEAATAVEAVLEARLAAEEEALLPALAGLPGADLPALVADLLTLAGGGRLDDPAVVDVREIPHGRRHPRIFTRFARLAPGEDFVLVNNHDPKPLRREFEATHPGAHTWEYVESGPDVWRVRIGRRTAPGD